jgi:hypothetical protein
MRTAPQQFIERYLLSSKTTIEGYTSGHFRVEIEIGWQLRTLHMTGGVKLV